MVAVLKKKKLHVKHNLIPAFDVFDTFKYNLRPFYLKSLTYLYRSNVNV